MIGGRISTLSISFDFKELSHQKSENLWKFDEEQSWDVIKFGVFPNPPSLDGRSMTRGLMHSCILKTNRRKTRKGHGRVTTGDYSEIRSTPQLCGPRAGKTGMLMVLWKGVLATESLGKQQQRTSKSETPCASAVLWDSGRSVRGRGFPEKFWCNAECKLSYSFRSALG